MNAAKRKQLKAALKRRGWTQQLLAAETGRTQGHISLLLLGQRESKTLLAQLVELSRRSPAEEPLQSA